MNTFRLDHHADARGWIAAAQRAVATGMEPASVEWQVDEQEASLFSTPPTDPRSLKERRSARFDSGFTRLVRQAICHNDPGRLSLLYRLAWRLNHGEPALLENTVDKDVHQVTRMAQATRRDAHKMKAFVRFRAMDDRLISWFEPEHQIVDAVAPFFRNRFSNEKWTIFTPSRSATWDRETLHCAPTGRTIVRPSEDQLEEYWKKYYASIFNPARLKVPMMRQEMPKKYWKNLPEAALIPGLIADADRRAKAMISDAVTAPARKGRTRYDRGSEAQLTTQSPLKQLSARIRACRQCPLWEPATQAVSGIGNATAGIVVVGEQPGDAEDLQGRPFVGPAGQVLAEAMAAAGLDRDQVFMTNAVKHFRFEARGKRRMHKNPSRRHIDACRHWLEHELALIRPTLVVALGRSALISLTGTADTLEEIRGSVIESSAFAILPTWHPAAILRGSDGDRMREELVTDLLTAKDYSAAYT